MMPPLSISRWLSSRYLLAEVLSDDEQLVLWNRRSSDAFPTVGGVLTLVECGELVQQTVLTQQEHAVIRLLLDGAPTPCPYERLYAALMEMEEDEAGLLLHKAVKAGVFALLVQPLRQVLVQCRVKLAPFALDIRDVPGGLLGDRLACGLFPLWNRSGSIEPPELQQEVVSDHEVTAEQQTDTKHERGREQEA